MRKNRCRPFIALDPRLLITLSPLSTIQDLYVTASEDLQLQNWFASVVLVHFLALVIGWLLVEIMRLHQYLT